ncbi:molybdopterin-dependent oxidoreductase [Anoxybacterium hadale]|uniref:Molybdopterin-dependent oxidoreductase n=1 Tax=Anoxybacterium hadale TaxID=3408580 RepID=A0ACD1A6V7_9FIRM|nr:molybdopterin-dependent oxidoreductase [Clostridiales bacterium]
MFKKRKGAYDNVLSEVDFNENVFGYSTYQWQSSDPSVEGDQQVLHGLCRMCMQGDCATSVHLEDGVVVKVEGREVPPNYGSLCPRGNSATMNLYNPYRVKTPLIRTNPEKGLEIDPKWKEVSWEEALDYTAKKLKEVRDEDPRGLAVCEGWGNRETIMRIPFRLAFGSPNEIGAHGSLCTVHYGTGLIHGNFPISVVDLEHCDYHITLGRSIGPNIATVPGTRKLTKALKRGMKLVVVDPRSSYEAAKGEWVPIRPGTDLAFLLGLAHSIIFDVQKYDIWFLKNRTNGPYLIDSQGDYLRDEETGKPMMWDLTDSQAKTFDAEFGEVALEGSFSVGKKEVKTGFQLIKEGFLEYTPEWAESISTVPAQDIRRIAGEFIEHARIGSTIEIEGFQFPYRPVSVNTERNVMNHRGGTYSDLVAKIINMLAGAIEVPGGCLGCGYRGPQALAPGPDGTMMPGYEAKDRPFVFPPDIGMHTFYPNSHTTPHLVAHALSDPEKYYLTYEVKAWLNIGGNIIKYNANPEQYVNMMRKIPFSVSIAYHMDEPTIMSDVVLPEHSFMERSRVAPFWPQHQAASYEVHALQMLQRRQPVKPIYNTMHVDDIFTELAERIGILYGENGMYDYLNKDVDYIIKENGLNLREPYLLDLNQKHTLAEIHELQVKSWKFGEGETMEDLERDGHIAKWQPKKTAYNYYYHPGNQTRHEFYIINLKKTADQLRQNLEKHQIQFPGVEDDSLVFDLYKPVPYWVPSSEFGVSEEYDLWAINWKTPYYSSDIGGVVGNPWLAEIYKKDPWEAVICLNSATAETKGIKDGDRVTVESRYGSLEGLVRISELFHPDAVGISGAYGMGTAQSNPLSKEGPLFNRLLTTKEDTLDSVSGGIEIAPCVRLIRKGGLS